MDQAEAAEIVEEHLKTHSQDQLFDGVLIRHRVTLGEIGSLAGRQKMANNLFPGDTGDHRGSRD